MVRPKKIPRNFVPVEWTDTEYDSSNTDTDTDIDTDTISSTKTEEVSEVEIDLDNDGNFTEFEQDTSEELNKFAEEWLNIEMAHEVSKCASDKFWNAAKFLLRLPTKTKIPAFTHIRRRLTRKYCPPVSIDLAYKNSENGEITILEDVRTISSTLRKPKFEPLFEIASVKVKKTYTFTKN